MVLIKQNPGGSRGKDRISELPEPLIHLILSLLQTKCVVSTSVLSKRWRYIWTSLLREVAFPEYVGLEDSQDRDGTSQEFERVQNLCLSLEQSLMNFLDKKLSLHHEAQDLKKFYLDTSDKFDPQREKLEEWLSALFTRHNLEEFVFYVENSLEEGLFPSSGKYASLVILELDTWEPVYLPDAVNFPNLKICKFTHAYLHMYSDDPTEQFFSNLAVLEELELTECQWNISDQLIISAPALKYLSITGPREYTYFDDDVPMYGFKMNIFAPNLLCCCTSNLNAVKTFLKNARVLKRMIIKFDSNLSTDEQNKVMKKLLQFPRGSRLVQNSGLIMRIISMVKLLLV
ncbi:hypothetical protein MKX03_022228 [Papaver bracteatum]|nr:hypothetical protein MKX03_022228 [Papaver bracteatum]